MTRLYINTTLEKSIRSYCEMNDIKDVNAFANRCAMQGFNVVKFGLSPKDNIDRENNGIKDVNKNEKKSKKEDPSRQNEGKQEKQKELRKENIKEEVKPTEERESKVTVRKIRIIKK